MELPIKGQKPVKVGNSHYFTIPSQYVRNEAIKASELYDLQIGASVLLKGLRPIKVGDSHYFPIWIEKIRSKCIKVGKAYDMFVLVHKAIKKRGKVE